MPGKYTVVLAVGGKTYQQSLTLAMDPRVKTSNADLAEQFRLSKQLYDEWRALNSISEIVKPIRGQIAELRPKVPEGDLKTHIDALAEKLQTLAGAGGGGRRGGGSGSSPSIATTTGSLRTLFGLIQEVDLAPTPQAAAAVPNVLKDSRTLQENWLAIMSRDIPSLNRELRAAGLPVIKGLR
jgi:hypothetical protein